MPKMRMRPNGEDKEKIRRLKEDIKDVKLDMEETFSIMEDMPKPPPAKKRKRKAAVKKAAVIGAAAVILIVLLIVLVLIKVI